MGLFVQLQCTLPVTVMSALGSFFGGDDNDLSSSSDEETEKVESVKKLDSSESDADEADDRVKLPPPTELLSSVQRPDFLKSADAQARRDLIAEKRAQLEQERLKDAHVAKGMYGAMAPPAECNVVSAKPVRYDTSSVAEAVAASTGALKRSHPESSDSGSAKKKMETFRQKEKRKRDLGQSSREKSYVEEEKRQLREAVKEGADVFGAD